jgi:hypothetical protein
MAKVITEKAQEQTSEVKQVEIKHTRSAVDAAGKTVDIVDYTEVKTVDEAISEAESRKTDLQARLTEVDAELADYIAIRDAE